MPVSSAVELAANQAIVAEKAENSTPEEKEALKEQYLKMKMAKNQVPDFVKQKKKNS